MKRSCPFVAIPEIAMDDPAKEPQMAGSRCTRDEGSHAAPPGAPAGIFVHRMTPALAALACVRAPARVRWWVG